MTPQIPLIRLPDNEEPFLTPVAVTTSKPKSEITKAPASDEGIRPAVSIVFILVICLLAGAFIYAAVRRIRFRRFEKRNRKQK